jgi:hypothetical protein
MSAIRQKALAVGLSGNEVLIIMAGDSPFTARSCVERHGDSKSTARLGAA